MKIVYPAETDSLFTDIKEVFNHYEEYYSVNNTTTILNNY